MRKGLRQKTNKVPGDCPGQGRECELFALRYSTACEMAPLVWWLWNELWSRAAKAQRFLASQ